MNKKKLRVAAYCRVSTDKDDQANSLASQRSYFAEYITNHEDWELKGVFFDEGISGTQTLKRSGFNQMIQDAMFGEFDLILTKEVCRFARNTVDTLSYTRKLKEVGIGVVFTIDNIDTRDSDGELRLTIMASIAQEESRKTSERVKWGQQRRMEQGIVFGRDLLGYTVQNGVLSVNEEEASIVRAIFNKYTNEGKGTHVIARELLEEGMRPKRMALWSNTVVLRVLRNEKYVGDLCQKKTFTPDYLTHAKKYNRGEEDMVYLSNHHEAIIDRDLWNRTQEELARRSLSQEQKSKHSNRYWCSGKIHCAECGNRYVSRTKKLQNGEIYKAWRCYAAANHGTLKHDADGNNIGCDNGSINDKSLLACMKYCIELIQDNRDELKEEILQEIKQIKKKSSSKTDTKRIQKKIESIELKKKKAIDLLLGGLINEFEFMEQKQWYDDELAELQISLSNAISADRNTLREVNEMQKYIDALNDIMDFERSELVFKEILEKIEIHKGNILDIWLKNIPVVIRLTAKSSGKLDAFKTEIADVQFISK